MSGAQEIQPLVDARPILPVSKNSLWDTAAERRDEIAGLIDRQLGKLHLKGWVRKSQPGEYPLYVAVDIWRPVEPSPETSRSGTFDRSFLKIVVEVEPYRQYPIIYSVELQRHGRKYVAAYWQMPYDELDEMVTYLVKGGSKPTFFRSRVPAIVRIISSFIPMPMSEYENKLIEEAEPARLTLPSVLGVVGAIGAFFGFSLAYQASHSYYSRQEIGPDLIFGCAGLVLIGLAVWLSVRRPVYQEIVKQPLHTPRREFVVDSWQVSVPEGGADFTAFQRRIHDALRKMDPELESSFETHQSLTPRGFESRDRLVITKGQGNVHVHIQPFGRDAFVGWDSYLNWARWSETPPISTVIRDGNRIEYKSLAAGAYVPSKFDLMELNALAETAHRNIVREIKAFLKEKEIEADLDFHIIRGDRGRALSEGKEESASQKSKTGAGTGGGAD
jgi:hypothetical protein